MPYQIISNRGHYEIYINGKFYCSADTYVEAVREVEDFQKEMCCVEA